MIAAARGLRYRDFLTVSVVLDGEDLFPDNWIYIHDPNVNVGPDPELPLLEPVDGPGPDQGLRRASSSSASPATSCGRWTTTSSSQLGMRELEQLGLARASSSSSASSSACPRPTRCTTPTTPSACTTIRSWLDGLDNFIQVGRNGLHRYNNSDHSMLTAMRAVDNLVKGTEHDIWAVNAESAYHEEEKQDEQQPYIEAPETESMKEPLHSLSRACRGAAFALALGAAVLHAGWNVLLAGARDSEAATAWRLLAGVALLAPVALLTWGVEARPCPSRRPRPSSTSPTSRCSPAPTGAAR